MSFDIYAMNLHKRQLLRTIAAACTAYATPWHASAHSTPPASDAWATSTRHLAAKLLSSNANAVMSPLSIWAALAMTHVGAQGETASEIAKALQMPNEAQAFVQSWQAVQALQHRVAQSPVKLHAANRVWLDAQYAVSPNYLQSLRRDYRANPALLDFVGQPESARQHINAWVNAQTHARIPELLPVGLVTSMTRLVLTQAMYLKAPWQTAFDTSHTRHEAFTLPSGRAVNVPMMHQRGEWQAGVITRANVTLLVVELPYVNDDLRMVLVVPQQAQHLNEAVAQIGLNWASVLRSQEVVLAVPRWKTRQALALNTALQQLGIRQAFSPSSADFSGISPQRDLYISAVQHEAFVEVSEEGTEAAAATAMMMTTKAMVPFTPPLQIRADRPFAWAVVDSKHRGVLFAGVVQDPRADN